MAGEEDAGSLGGGGPLAQHDEDASSDEQAQRIQRMWCEMGASPAEIAEQEGMPKSAFGSLHKRQNELPDTELDELVRNIVDNSYLPRQGYRNVARMLRLDHGVLVGNHRVRLSLLRIAAQTGLVRRRFAPRRVPRRPYQVPGSMYVWHMDANLKLQLMGNICIHLLVDGYSRRIIYAFVASNKSSSTVELAFRWATHHFGFPYRLRTDYGQENVLAHQLQWDHWRVTPGNPVAATAVLTGASVHNQRVERLNRDLNAIFVPWRDAWMAEFLPYLDGGVVTEAFLFAMHDVLLPELQAELGLWMGRHNSHRIQGGPIPNQAFLQSVLPLPSVQDFPRPEDMMAFWRENERTFLAMDEESERWPALRRHQFLTDPDIRLVREHCLTAASVEPHIVERVFRYHAEFVECLEALHLQ